MAASPDEEPVSTLLAAAGLAPDDADLADLSQAYAGFRELAGRICAVSEADDDWSDVGFRLGG